MSNKFRPTSHLMPEICSYNGRDIAIQDLHDDYKLGKLSNLKKCDECQYCAMVSIEASAFIWNSQKVVFCKICLKCGYSKTEREVFFEKESDIDGGPLILDKAPRIFQELRIKYIEETTRICRETFTSNTPGGPVEFIFSAFIQNLSLDSVVVGKRNEYYIFLYAGVFSVLHDIFCALLSHPKILPNVGLSSNEIWNDSQTWNGYQLDLGVVDNIEKTLQFKFFKRIPRDPLRRKYAESLARIGTDFIFYHEISHVIAGHFELAGYKDLTFRYHERKTFHALQSSIDPKKKDMLEYDADRIAIKLMIRFLSSGVNFRGTSNRDKKQQLDIIEALTFSIGTLFRLLSSDIPQLHTFESKTHPHPEIRMLLIFVALMEISVSISQELKPIILGAYVYSKFNVWHTLELLGVKTQNSCLEKQLLDEISIDIIHRLDQMEPELHKVSHHNIIHRWSKRMNRYV